MRGQRNRFHIVYLYVSRQNRR